MVVLVEFMTFYTGRIHVILCTLLIRPQITTNLHSLHTYVHLLRNIESVNAFRV